METRYGLSVSCDAPVPSSAIDEINKFPAPTISPETGAISGVLCRRVGKLGRRHHVISLRHETFGNNSLQLNPETVFVPVLKDPLTLSILSRGCAEHVGEVRLHHFGDCIGVVGTNCLPQSTDKRLKVDIRRLLIRRTLWGHGCLLGIFFWVGRRTGGEEESDEH